MAQTVQAKAPATEFLPLAQLIHAVSATEPMAALALPAAQAAQPAVLPATVASDHLPVGQTVQLC